MRKLIQFGLGLLILGSASSVYYYLCRTSKYKRNLNHNVAIKQVIAPSSPMRKEQEDFMSEGGNSQPLAID